jgi:hypothetical protein
MDAIAQLARTEAAAARIIAGEDQASDNNPNVTTGAQFALVIGAGTPLTLTAGGPVVMATSITTHFAPLVKVTATVTGAFGAGATACVAQLQTSGDGGVTWTALQTVDVSGPDTAGSAAGQVGGAALTWIAVVVLNVAQQFRVQVAPVGGSFTTTVGHGGLVVEEA